MQSVQCHSAAAISPPMVFFDDQAHEGDAGHSAQNTSRRTAGGSTAAPNPPSVSVLIPQEEGYETLPRGDRLLYSSRNAHNGVQPPPLPDEGTQSQEGEDGAHVAPLTFDNIALYVRPSPQCSTENSPAAADAEDGGAATVCLSRAREGNCEASDFRLRQQQQQRRRRCLRSISHVQDHDACLYTPLRKSAWFLRILAEQKRTSPYDADMIFSSFSVKNHFMFCPPPPTYVFFVNADNVVTVIDSDDSEDDDNEEADVSEELRTGARHGIASNPCSPVPSAASFEFMFLPWQHEVQSYRIEKNEVVLERRVTVGFPREPLQYQSPIPCSVIRPQHLLSSHIGVFFHCNGEDIGSFSCTRLFALANALHMTLFVPEYPGFGLFNGCVSEATVKQAMERFFQYLFSVDGNITPSRLVLIGHSIGAAVAIHAAKFIEGVFETLVGNFPGEPCVSLIPGTIPEEEEKKNVRGREYLPTSHTRQCTDSPHEPYGSLHSTEELSEASPDSANRTVTRQKEKVAGAAACKCNPSSTSSPSLSDSQGAKHDNNNTGCNSSSGGSSSRSSNHSSSEKKDSATRARGVSPLCSHCSLGGLILISSFASVHCIESTRTFDDYGLDVREMELRRLRCREDAVLPAPDYWAQDARTVDKNAWAASGAHTPKNSVYLSVSRYLDTNSFPTIERMTQLQERSRFFNRTPVLFVHGSDDVLVPPLHSVALCSKIRQCKNGGADARVYTIFVKGGGHNNINCVCLLRRFYKDYILTPHLRRQLQQFMEVDELFQSARATPREGAAGAGEVLGEQRFFEAERRMENNHVKDTTQNNSTALAASARNSPEDGGAPPHVHFLTPNATLTFQNEEVQRRSSGGAATLAPSSRRGGGASSSPPHFSRQLSLSFPRSPYFGSSGQTQGFSAQEEVAPRQGGSMLYFIPSLVPDDSHVAAEASGSRGVTVDKDLVAREGSPGSAEALAEDGEGLHALNQSLREALRRTQLGDTVAPVAALIHIAMHPSLDSFDIGSVVVSSVREHALSFEEARQKCKKYDSAARFYFIFRSSAYSTMGAFILAVGITHAVLTQKFRLIDHVPPGVNPADLGRDNRVVAWAVLEAFMFLIFFLRRLLHPLHTYRRISKLRWAQPSVFFIYLSVRILSYCILVGVGVLMAMVLALAPGGVHWEKWNVLPYSRRVWISYIPRWTMVTLASVHLFCILFAFVRNH